MKAHIVCDTATWVIIPTIVIEKWPMGGDLTVSFDWLCFEFYIAISFGEDT